MYLSRNSPLPLFPSLSFSFLLLRRVKQRCAARASASARRYIFVRVFSRKIDDDDDENFGRLYTSRVNETTEKPKRQAPHWEKRGRKKSMRQKFKNIWGKWVDETVCDCMYPFLASDVSWLRFSLLEAGAPTGIAMGDAMEGVGQPSWL